MSENNLLENEDCQIVTSAENGLFTISALNLNSCFDLSNLPKIETLDSLLKNLCEVMIRFDGGVKDYQKADFEQLIKTISNSLIYLYTNTSPMNTGNHVVGFRGIAHLDTDPYLGAIELNNSYPGIYFAQDIGIYEHFSVGVNLVEVTATDSAEAIVLLVPYINSDGEVVRYDKNIYNLDTSTINTQINNEVQARIDADNALQASIDMALTLGLDDAPINTEVQARIAADTALQVSIDAIEDGVGTLVGRVGGMETEIHESAVRIETLEGKTEVLEDDVNTLENNANLLKNRLDAVAATADMALVLGLD